MPEAAAQRNVPTPQEQILGIVNNHWQGRCVGVAAQLELADALAKRPLHVDVLAERTQTHAASLYPALSTWSEILEKEPGRLIPGRVTLSLLKK